VAGMAGLSQDPFYIVRQEIQEQVRVPLLPAGTAGQHVMQLLSTHPDSAAGERAAVAHVAIPWAHSSKPRAKNDCSCSHRRL
jgi:hypothetical protein